MKDISGWELKIAPTGAVSTNYEILAIWAEAHYFDRQASKEFDEGSAWGASFLRFEIQAQNWLTDIGPNGLVKALVLGGLGSLRLSLF